MEAVIVGNGGPEVLVQGISGLALAVTAAGPQVVTTTGSQGGLLARDAGSLAVTHSRPFAPPGAGIRPSEGQVATLTLDGRPALVAYGARGGAEVMWLDRPGDPLAGAVVLPLGGATLTALAAAPLAGGGDVLFAATLQEQGLSAWVRAPNGALSALGKVVMPPGDGGGTIPALATLSHGGAEWLVAASASTDSVLVWKIGPGGTTTPAGSLGPADGLGIATPSQLRAVSAGGHDYLLIGAAGTSSLVVAEMGAGGRLIPRDQVNDDLFTRFQGVTALDVVESAGRVFVAAGGADRGVTVLELLPGGRLVHLASFEDTATTTLAQPTGLALAVSDGGLDIYVSSMTEAGVTRLRLDLGGVSAPQQAGAGGAVLTGGAGADLLIGGAGADVLKGGAGDDILVGSAGDRLTGGAGRDLFVIQPGRGTTTITDFEPGADRLDLSALGRLYSASALDFTVRPDGLEIRFGAEVIRLQSASGGAIQPATLTEADLLGLWHLPVNLLVPEDLVLTAGDGGELLVGDAGNDTLTGGAGSDVLLGGDGDDLLIGGPGADLLLGGAGNDILIGGSVHEDFDTAAAAVFRIYQAALGRLPDRGGHLNWTTRVTDGTPLLQLSTAFLNSPEFTARFGGVSDSAGFVTLLYQNVLGRAPDAGGLAYWSGALDSGRMSRAQVLQGFSQSAEFTQATATEALAFSHEGHMAMAAGDIFRLYRAVLDRTPDAGGLDYWTGQLADGTGLREVAAAFVRSPEFSTRFGGVSDSAGFVALLYQNVLGRAPDASGLAYWTGALDSGQKSPADLVLGFSQSPEFIAATQGALVARMRALGGGDRLEGGPGDDILFGSARADVFVFSPDDPGADRVAGLDPWDRIDLAGFGYGSARDALAHFTATSEGMLFQHGATSALFLHATPGAITADMLIL